MTALAAAVRARCSTLWTAGPGADAVVLRVIVAVLVPFGWVVLLLSCPPVQRLIRRLRRRR